MDICICKLFVNLLTCNPFSKTNRSYSGDRVFYVAPTVVITQMCGSSVLLVVNTYFSKVSEVSGTLINVGQWRYSPEQMYIQLVFHVISSWIEIIQKLSFYVCLSVCLSVCLYVCLSVYHGLWRCFGFFSNLYKSHKVRLFPCLYASLILSLCLSGLFLLYNIPLWTTLDVE